MQISPYCVILSLFFHTIKAEKIMAILKGIYVENYASFADRVEFSCESVNNKKDHTNNTFVSGDTELNLVSYIYGANGSGKSYFCRVIQKIRDIIYQSSTPNQTQQAFSSYPQTNRALLQPKCFAFDTVYYNKPTTFGLDFLLNNISYRYEFSIYNNEIVYEKLQKKKRRTETILLRTSPFFKDIDLKSELKDFTMIKHVVRKDALCLAIAANLNNPLAIEIINSVGRLKLFNMTTPHLAPANITLFQEKQLQKYMNILKKADPTLEKLEVSFLEENLQPKTNPSDFESREFVKKYISVSVKTEHALYDNGHKIDSTNSDIDFFTEESLGTVKLFTTLPYLFDVLKNGDVLILDEIENGLHLALVKEIINLFLDPKRNPYKAQLICTSHQPLLLDGTNPKRDQVWIMHKDSKGKSSISRLSDDSSVRLNSNLSNKIVEGALGCSPSSFFEEQF